MRILLLGFGKIAYMPYMHLYLDTLKDEEFDLIYWDRDGKPDDQLSSQIKNAYKFEAYLEEQLPFKNKLKYFWKYRQYAKKILRKNNYDFVIVLHTTPGLTMLDQFVMRYRNRYILDFRDISYEYVRLYRNLVGVLSRYSKFTFVSSDAFRKYLPESIPIYTVHNFNSDSLRYKHIRAAEPRARDVIRIGYWGLVRQVDVNIKLIKAVGNDKRFELHYYGRMQQDGRDMENYAIRQGYSNIFFHGSYLPDERYGFAVKTDIIHNIYDTGYITGNAMGNKYYDGLVFRLPQICMEGSYMGERVKTEGVGKAITLNDSHLGDHLWNYYTNIDWTSFMYHCDSALMHVVNEQEQTKAQLYSIIL